MRTRLLVKPCLGAQVSESHEDEVERREIGRTTEEMRLNDEDMGASHRLENKESSKTLHK